MCNYLPPKLKDNSQTRRKYLLIMYLIRDHYPDYIKKNSYNSILKRDRGKRSEFSKGDDKPRANKPVKRCSTSSIIRKMQNYNELPLNTHWNGDN